MLRVFLCFVFIAFSSSDSTAALYLLKSTPEGRVLFVVAPSSTVATELAGRIPNSSNQILKWDALSGCKPGGWFAFIRGHGDFAGACNFASREMAKRAVIQKCRQKPGCAPVFNELDGGDLESGFDEPGFDPLLNLKNMESLRLPDLGLFPRREFCTIRRQNPKCYSAIVTPTEIVNGASASRNGQTFPFDPDNVGKSPWDQ